MKPRLTKEMVDSMQARIKWNVPQPLTEVEMDDLCYYARIGLATTRSAILQEFGDSDGLKPCPFCGGTKTEMVLVADQVADSIHIECSSCGARGGGRFSESTDRVASSCYAKDEWNKRKP